MKEEIAKYVFTTLVGIIGFFIVKSYNNVALQLAKLQEDVVGLKIALIEIQKSTLDEARVKEIVDLELIKHGLIQK